METPKNMETQVVWPAEQSELGVPSRNSIWTRSEKAMAIKAGQVTIVSTFPHHIQIL
jgi:hypothetical protein